MKQNVRRALAISGIAVVIGTTGIAYNAHAKVETKTEKAAHRAENKTNKELNKTRQRRVIHGIVSELGDGTFTVKKGDKSFEVKTTSTTSFFNREHKKIQFSDIKNGDRIRIKGNILGTIMTAQIVRDVSIK